MLFRSQGSAFLPRISRRLIALFAFGILHITLLWDGDILVIYSITGFLLILFRYINTQSLKRWILALLAIPAALVFLIFIATLLLRFLPSVAQTLRESDLSIAQSFADTTATRNLLHAGFHAGIHDRWMTYVNLLPLLLSRISTVLAMFLLGLWIGKSGFLRTLEQKVEFLKKVRNVTLPLGFAFMLAIVLATKFLPTTSALIAIIEDQYLAGPILCLGYASALLLSYVKNPQRKLFEALSSLGRMALTNYLLQSLILTSLSYGWGFGLALKLNGFQVMGISLCLFIAQVYLSQFWLRHFSFGPLEWVWRCVTYWRFLPIVSKSKALNSVYE